ncbi:hypothetical protein STAS_12012 [Striga asiatica]|uniref:Uncharacterized protein n=1 Tax=Striga asiatica TaxID=4170 RepID=A0A5A7PST1_STRAF|nr:hypothetical protein STAS_12012 [Striga asiatica]
MGGQISRTCRSYSTRRPSPSAPPGRTLSTPNSRSRSGSDSGSGSGSRPAGLSESDLSSYEAACRADPDLRTFDSTLRARTTRAIHSIAVGSDVRSLSLESLSQVTECLLETNQEVVRIILRHKRDVWRNKDLSDLVDDYFENSLLTLDFCAALDACLARASRIESVVSIALRRFEEEHHHRSPVPETPDPAGKYSKTLAELRNFAAAGDPFTEDFFRVFNSVYSNQLLILQRLQAKKRKLDGKLRKLKVWRKVSNAIFVAAFASVLICSVVAAAVTAPPVLTALAAAAAVPLGSMGRWLNSIWKNCERDLTAQREIVGSMQIGSYIVIKDLEGIRALVDKFRIELESLLADAEFADRGGVEEDEVAVVIAVEEIKKKLSGFIKTIRDLGEHANKCTQETRMARTLILRKIINYPNGSGEDMGMFS